MGSSPPSKTVVPAFFFDTDVIVSWLIDETDPNTGYSLGKAPRTLVERIESGKAIGQTSLFTLLELRFLLKRRKALPREKIEALISQLEPIFRVVIPDELALLRANALQADHAMGPIDAVQLATASLLETPCTFISRDAALLKVARLFLEAKTPEELLGFTT